VIVALAVVFGVVGFLFCRDHATDAVPEGLARGNGRIEAVEIDVAS
jgi:HlyD family secretion protein